MTSLIAEEAEARRVALLAANERIGVFEEKIKSLEATVNNEAMGMAATFARSTTNENTNSALTARIAKVETEFAKTPVTIKGICDKLERVEKLADKAYKRNKAMIAGLNKAVASIVTIALMSHATGDEGLKLLALVRMLTRLTT